MITWGKERGECAGQAAEIGATVVMILGAAYFLGHILAAWLRGSFAAVIR